MALSGGNVFGPSRSGRRVDNNGVAKTWTALAAKIFRGRSADVDNTWREEGSAWRLHHRRWEEIGDDQETRWPSRVQYGGGNLEVMAASPLLLPLCLSPLYHHCRCCGSSKGWQGLSPILLDVGAT
ncbi:hypothetical protein E2562_021261 [Oryza meyeriana var. granulata]|uniref:Uncharacterized protein n=1 Tax=Oryza meyeriana var. granulata TaxID=110450 RepID=A0A6G1DZJ5_9ORYZ|nr:hypothetical protein E2562_021261 [Oryza meyeriana var. granulata]